MKTRLPIPVLAQFFLKNPQTGFTLIELMIVTIILGVLAAISIPQLFAMVAKARETEIQTQIASLLRAENVYYLEHGHFAKISNREMRNHTHGLDVAISNDYYDIRTTLAIHYNAVRVKATAIKNYDKDFKNYTAGLHYSRGVFASIICQTHDPGGDINYIAQFTLSNNQPHAKCDLAKGREIQ
ncbi:type IV pilin protein [Crocosphaera sp.]|uniref:type IV pilin protein n=1 Tax=Crocosphaera sp. TaxID=2729996 RepID=UPI003F27EB55|nr:prepilin-type N-terminal cleavage/methylation domain-containing protein [Crocosphaera sp.]